MKKRRCLFKKWNNDSEIEEGIFHCWGLDFLESNSGNIINFTVAIVETSDGVVYKVNPSFYLKFI